MRQTIFLYATEYGVENRVTKELGRVGRGQIPIKLTLDIEETAFREPIITKEVKIEDWRQGVDIADVDFKETFITEEEAEAIRQMRFNKMSEILKKQGYSVISPESSN